MGQITLFLEAYWLIIFKYSKARTLSNNKLNQKNYQTQMTEIQGKSTIKIAELKEIQKMLSSHYIGYNFI